MIPAWKSFFIVFLREAVTPLPSRTRWTTYRSIPGTIPRANVRTADLEESTMMGFPLTARMDSKNARGVRDNARLHLLHVRPVSRNVKACGPALIGWVVLTHDERADARIVAVASHERGE